MVCLLARLCALFESITYAVGVSVIDQIIVIFDESVSPWCFLLARWAFEVGGESL